MKFGLLKVFALGSVVPLTVALNACGDDSSTSSPTGKLPTEVKDLKELEEHKCDMGVIGEKVFVESEDLLYECDGDAWFKSYDQTKPNSAKSSSSMKAEGSNDEGGDENSPDSEKGSSSSVTPSDSEGSSSNSAKSSSSVNSSSSVKSSSSSSAKSSSSVASSSSEYVPFDHSQTLGSIGQEGVYKTFTDSRNGRSYYYMEFKGVNKQGDSATVTAMAENLNIGEMVAGDKDQADDSKVERYCYDNDTINCDRYGGLYQWAEMMKLPSECNTKSCADSIKPNHQGICPDEWRLLTYDDFVVILNSNGNNDGIKGVRSTFGFGGYNTTGYSLVGAGYRKNDGSFKDIDDGTYWTYPLEHETNVTRVRSSYTSIHQTAFAGLGVNDKSYGFSVRCVKVE